MQPINYDLIDSRIVNSIRSIESKPHVRYIRYLLTKRYSPIMIKTELFKAGLSAPHEPTLIKYYLEIIDPIIKHFGLSDIYASYKSKLLSKNQRCSYSKAILNYKFEMGEALDTQTKFCEFIRYLEVDSLWVSEIFRCHGKVSNMPVDEMGKRILDVSTPYANIERILTCEKRYAVDKLILEGLNDTRIAEYCRSTLKIPRVFDYDVRVYKKFFFNIQSQSIEDKIKLLESEKVSLTALLESLNTPSADEEFGIVEKGIVRRQAERRIEELEESIKTLNMMFTDAAHKVACLEVNDFESMFTDVTLRAYTRFKNLDQYADREVIDGLMKITKIMINAHDKVEVIKNNNNAAADKHSQAVILELYKKRANEIDQEQVERANKELAKYGDEPMDPNIDLNEIGGIEEIGVNIEEDKQKKEEA